jgi:secreted Zn-dependent insulinase-like peptidase
LLASEAEKITYEEFIGQRDLWLKKGRLVWFVLGNISSKNALKLATDSNALFNLKTEAKEDLPDYRILSIPTQEKGNMRLDFKVMDESNENSCFMTYFQAVKDKTNENKLHLLNDIANQFMEDPTFNQLRTQE